MSSTSQAKTRASIELKRVREALPSEFQMKVRSGVVMALEYGTEWKMVGGFEHLTAAGMRQLSEAYVRAGDFDAARWCNQEAARLDAEDSAAALAELSPVATAAPSTPEPLAHPEADAYAALERRGLA